MSSRARLSGVVVAVAFAVVLLAGSVARAESVTFTLSNGTSATIVEFYASPPNERSWEEDILGEDVLEPGQSVSITIADGREDCSYDFRAVIQTANDEEFEVVHDAVSVCDGTSYTYTE